MVGNSVLGGLPGGSRDVLNDVSNTRADGAADGSKDVKVEADTLSLAVRPAMRFLNQPVVITRPTQASRFTIPSLRVNRTTAIFNDAKQAQGSNDAHRAQGSNNAHQAQGSDIEPSHLAVSGKKPSIGNYFEQGQALEENYHTAPLRIEQMLEEEEEATEAREAQAYQAYLIALQNLANKQEASESSVRYRGEGWAGSSQCNSTTQSMDTQGDNSTGYLTIAVPNLTAEDFAELHAAERFVLAHQNNDDVEDDLWDISMVAEYSEDIFEYLREQEVSQILIFSPPAL